MPDLTGFKELGFKVRTSRGQLFVEKIAPSYKVSFSQGFEPDHPTWGELVDFEIPDGLIVVEFEDSLSGENVEHLSHELEGLFRFLHNKDSFLFLFDHRLDFNTPQIGVKMEKLIQILEEMTS